MSKQTLATSIQPTEFVLVLTASFAATAVADLALARPTQETALLAERKELALKPAPRAPDACNHLRADEPPVETGRTCIAEFGFRFRAFFPR